MKRILVLSVTFLALFGVAITATPFILYLNPSAKAKAQLPRLDISDMKNGTFKIVQHSSSPEYYDDIFWSYLLIKKLDGNISAWRIFTRNNKVMMPDYRWWRPYFEYRSFGPTLENGVINESMPITCHDKDIAEGMAEDWNWDINGKNIAGYFDDLLPVKGFVELDYYAIGKSN